MRIHRGGPAGVRSALLVLISPLALALLLVPGLPLVSTAQTKSVEVRQPKSDVSTYLFAGIGGFIPLNESYRVNYSTNLGGLPIEMSGGFLFPVGPGVFVPITARYVRREANFVTGTSVEVLSVEPGVRFFLERKHARDLRMFGAVEALLGQAAVQGNYDVSNDGAVTGSALAHKNYLDLGMGFDLGLTYPLTPATALDAMVHIAIFMTSPIANGGLGNIGGVSITAAYRFGF